MQDKLWQDRNTQDSRGGSGSACKGKNWDKLGLGLSEQSSSEQAQPNSTPKKRKEKEKTQNTAKKLGTNVGLPTNMDDREEVDENGTSDANENEENDGEEGSCEEESEKEIGSVEEGRQMGNQDESQTLSGNKQEVRKLNEGREEEVRKKKESQSNVQNADVVADDDDVSHAPHVPHTTNATATDHLPSNTNPVSGTSKTSNTEDTVEETEDIFVDAVEDKGQEDNLDDLITVVDEYVEVRTPGAKLLDAITPKPKTGRRRRKQEGQKYTGAGTEDHPVSIDISNTQSGQINLESDVIPDTTTTAAGSSNSQARLDANTKEASRPSITLEATTNKSAETTAVGSNASRQETVSQASVGKNQSAEEDIDYNSQSDEAFQQNVDRANQITADRETQGHTETADNPRVGSMYEQTPSKTKQTKLTLEGVIYRNTSDSDLSENEKEKGGKGAKGKGKPKGKGKGKGKKPNPNTSQARKLRSQSVQQ